MTRRVAAERTIPRAALAGRHLAPVTRTLLQGHDRLKPPLIGLVLVSLVNGIPAGMVSAGTPNGKGGARMAQYVTVFVIMRTRYLPDGMPERHPEPRFWVLVTVPATDEAPFALDGSAQGVRFLKEARRFRESMDATVGEEVTTRIWSAEELDVNDLGRLESLPGLIQERAAKLLDSPFSAAGLNDPLSDFGAKAGADFLLEPVMGPVKRALHGLEIIGILVGALTGHHIVAATCWDHLCKDMLSDVLAKLAGELREALTRPEATDGPGEALSPPEATPPPAALDRPYDGLDDNGPLEPAV